MNPLRFLRPALSPAPCSLAAITLAAFTAKPLPAANPSTVPEIVVKADHSVAKVSPMLYGLMTEEINYAYEGGLYAELIRNRTFKADRSKPVYWDTIGDATISVDRDTPLNSALDLSLKLETGLPSAGQAAGITNNGYWGIPVKPHTTYRVSFYAKSNDVSGPLTVAIQSDNGKKVFASAEIPAISSHWKKYETTMTTGDVTPSKDNRFILTTNEKGTLWLQQVSLFPPTFNNRPNGTRIDLMKMLQAMHPKFLRFPGGNYLEGGTVATRFNWKKTIGDISQRPGHMDDAWGYWSNDGMGLLEFLEWCQDLHMQPLLAVYAGYSLRHIHVNPGPDLQPYVQDALDEIEYITGGTDTKWGAERAKDGHPAPFPLHYVEIGNEDWFDRSGSYDARFAQFFDAIRAKYPNLKLIATAKVKSRTPDLIDEHYYRSEEEMEAQSDMYDHRKRGGPTKVFVGEWATRVGSPTPDMAGALGDAAWMCGMERNSDLVIMSSYAPLFVNVSDLSHGGSMQWHSDLIGYNALTCYGSPSYYAQRMFSTHHGDQILATKATDIPTYSWQPHARRRHGVLQPRPPVRAVPSIAYDATRESANGVIYLKVVNRQDTPQPIHIRVSGTNDIEPSATAIVMKSANRSETNSIANPTNIVPVTETINGVSTDFTRTFPALSITILELRTK